MPLEALEKEQIRSFILPGGKIPEVDTAEVKVYLQDLKKPIHEVFYQPGLCETSSTRPEIESNLFDSMSNHFFMRRM